MAQDRDTGIPNLLRLRITSADQSKFYLGEVTYDENRIHRAEILTANDINRDEFGEIFQFNVEVRFCVLNAFMIITLQFDDDDDEEEEEEEEEEKG